VTFNNIFGLMMKALLEFGGLKMDELIGSRSVFQGHRMGVTL
jgi:hypothetical protein